MNEAQDTLKTPLTGTGGARSPLNDGSYVPVSDVIAKLQSDLGQVKNLQPLPKGMTLSWKFPKKRGDAGKVASAHAQLQFKFWEPDGTKFPQHVISLGKVSWGTYLQLASKLRLLHAKLHQYHPSEYNPDKVVEFWQWADIELRGKSDVVLGEKSPPFTDVVKWLRESKKGIEEGSFNTNYSSLLRVPAEATLKEAILKLPEIMAHENGKNTRLNALSAWKAISELPQLVDSESSREILRILKKFPKIKESKSGYERNTYVPNTADILRTYELGCNPVRYLKGAACHRIRNGKEETFTVKKPKSYDLGLRYKWAFLVLATYGSRIHELSHVANWTIPVTLKAGDWVSLSNGDKLGADDEGKDDTLADFEQLASDQIIPAWNDTAIPNEARVLAIKADTKTGFRLAVPLSPVGQDWVQMLLDSIHGELHSDWGGCPVRENGLNLSKDGNCNLFTDRMVSYISTGATPENTAVAKNEQRILWEEVFGANWPKYKFSAHKLRHAWNHRAHAQGLPVSLIAQSLGHRIATNLSTYFKNKPDEAEMAIMQNAASDLIAAIKKEQSPKLSLDSAVAVASSLMDENGMVEATKLIAAIYGLKADEIPINR